MRPQPDRPIPVRRVRPRFDVVGGRLWFGGDRFRTALFNAYTMLLCDEFEFVAIVRAYLPTVRDEALRRQLKAWLAQESSHGVQHRRAWDYLDRAGYRFRAYHKIENLLIFRFLFRLLGRKARIALIAALEHFNTLMGEMCLRRPDYFARVDHELGLLLSWHFAEEIEHRAVIHDTAQAVGVGYLTRIVTGAMAFALYAGVLLATTFWFAAQSSDLLRPSTYVQMFRFMFVDERFVQFVLAYARDYLSPRFHPLSRDTDHFAEAVLRGLATVRSAA
ncbi:MULTISPECIES: metal-dependent hydrolase [unclassified Burkholderia]|uniref:metal-dependent hydrolase n=1 Tax=unclassified Burkholderia TaxID=2613784 RepID=UPI00119C1481|nr:MULTISPECIES: metal-dependent hydrolase [unclassified Burkholderia]TWC59651.1 putative metal-dependent hydrolase [Burkholderia sp. SJZ089]TWC94628.1 putative metal-dependent hydrolase [Burkholderia sp. SJZ115]TWC96540.1 putative metal-dependent hydrolase [Burkholderia sp. SJZ091]